MSGLLVEVMMQVLLKKYDQRAKGGSCATWHLLNGK